MQCPIPLIAISPSLLRFPPHVMQACYKSIQYCYGHLPSTPVLSLSLDSLLRSYCTVEDPIDIFPSLLFPPHQYSSSHILVSCRIIHLIYMLISLPFFIHSYPLLYSYCTTARHPLSIFRSFAVRSLCIKT